MENHLRDGRHKALKPVALCRLADIPEGGTKGVEAEGPDGMPRDLFLHRTGESVACFENSCPHMGTPLDWRPDEFLSEDGAHFICATHGALFRLEDGHCVFGPCAGKRLTAVPVVLRDGMVLLAG
jgi:nitrite reductase/ring-hydroxylating ferredoxin subunit